MDTQTQIERLIDLAIIQRSELKKLVSELPQLREHLNAEIERVFEDAEPQLRTELEDWTTKQAKDQTAKLGGELEAKIAALSKSLEATTQTRYNAIMAERAQNIDLAKKAEDKLAEVAQAIPVQVKQIVTDELARFPRAGEIDQLRKEFAEPRGLNPRGRWQVGETYNKLDLVSYNGDSYVSSTDGNREKPSRSSETWTLSAARGNGGAGGGVTSLTDLVAVPANGELLIGNGSAFVNNTLTAGTGVTITNGPGTITIDASGAQEILTATVTNAESVAITRGQVVYLFGAVGNRASVKLANNATDAESSKTFGVVSETSIAAGANGLVTCVGTVDKLALGSYTEGDVLYLGATPGSVTATKPYAPNHLVYVGIVERANNGNGELYVRIQNGFELDEIHDVQITSAPLAGSLLMRDATNSLWKANSLTGTANQVTVTNADTSVTLSLPTTIANVNSVTAATSQNLTLAGGSTGASLVLGQGANGAATLALPGTGGLNVTGSVAGAASLRTSMTNSNAGGFSDAFWFNDSSRYVGIQTGGSTVTGTFAGLNRANIGKLVGNVDNLAIGTEGTLAPIVFVQGTTAAEKMRLSTGSNLLIGTTTDSGNGKLQLATHTTSAGGIGFGTDVSLFRNNATELTVNASAFKVTPASGNAFIYNTVTGGGIAGLAFVDSQASGRTFGIETGRTAGSFSIRDYTAGSNRLTFDSTGATTFASTLTANGFINASTVNSLVKATDGTIVTKIQSLSVGDPNVGYVGTESNHTLKIITNNTARLTIDTAGAATFAGAVTVNSSITAGTGSLSLNGSSGNGVNIHNTLTSGVSIGAVPTVVGILSVRPVADGIFNFRNAAGLGSYTGGAIDMLNDASNTVTNLTIRAAETNFIGVGATKIASTTPSTGAGSGALQVAGGIYAGAASVFGGTVTTTSTGFSATNASGSVEFLGSRSSTGNGVTVTYKTGATLNWFHGLRGLVDNNWYLFNNSTSTNTLIFDYGTNAATFAGKVAINGGSVGSGDFVARASTSNIGNTAFLFEQANGTAIATIRDNGTMVVAGDIRVGNTVNTVTPTSPNRTITMIVGGTVYYIHAKTTND